MGGFAPKHSIALSDGRAMIEHVIDAMSRVCERVVLIRAKGKAQGLQSLGFDAPIVFDLRENVGPLGGIEALLASGVGEEYLVCPCDVPRITSDALEALLVESDALSTILRVGRETASPLPARISARALPAVRELLDEGRRAVHQLHERVGAHIIDVPEDWRAMLTNVNTPEDLAALNTP